MLVQHSIFQVAGKLHHNAKVRWPRVFREVMLSGVFCLNQRLSLLTQGPLSIYDVEPEAR